MKIIFFLSLPFLIMISGYLFLNSSNSYKPLIEKDLVFSSKITEVDHRYLVLSDSSIVFSANKDSIYCLTMYNKDLLKEFRKDNISVFSPLLVNNTISGLSDNNGDEQFKIDPYLSNKYLKGEYIEKAYSFNNGNYLILELKGNGNTIFINLLNEEKIELSNLHGKLNGVAFQEMDNFLIISSGELLVRYDIKNKSLSYMATTINGEKLNPFIYKNKLYFTNNYYSEYFSVYQLDVNDNKSKPIVFHDSSNDVRLPKYKDGYLYYIEIINSEYLLKRKNIKNNTIESLTKKGVVYYYDFFASNNLVISYSDFFTPRCIAIVNIDDKTIKNISGNSIDMSSTYIFHSKTQYLSPAYEFAPAVTHDIKGTVLFIHPGLHLDFSPRWDTILMALVENGYRIISPNYPMSAGYGKNHFLSEPKAAILDILKWKKYLLEKYNKEPLHLLTSSSGNLLMESILEIDNEDITSSVSLFGLSGIRPQEKTLYVLGKIDSRVNFDMRYSQLQEYQTSSNDLVIATYNNEGHWLRNIKNTKDALLKIINYFGETSCSWH